MAIKIIGAICGIAWALALIPMLVVDFSAGPERPIGIVSVAAGMVAVPLTVVLIVMALVNYARRPR